MKTISETLEGLRSLAAEMTTAAETEPDSQVAAWFRDWAEAVTAQHDLFTYLIEAHAPGEVDAAAVCLPGDKGATPAQRVLSMLKLAKARGAFNPHTLKLGDRVRIARKTRAFKDDITVWASEMDATLGKSGVVVDLDGDFEVEVDGERWWYPLAALELDTNPRPQGLP